VKPEADAARLERRTGYGTLRCWGGKISIRRRNSSCDSLKKWLECCPKLNLGMGAVKKNSRTGFPGLVKRWGLSQENNIRNARRVAGGNHSAWKAFSRKEAPGGLGVETCKP